MTSAATSYETIPSNYSMSDLSVDMKNAAAQVQFPLPILHGILAKARTLLSTDGAIAPEARMVLSYITWQHKGRPVILAVTQVAQTGSHWDSALTPLL